MDMTSWLKRGPLVTAGLLAVLAGETAQAATQGSLGSTSTGSVSISASVPSRVRISGLSDVALTNVDPSVDASNAQATLHNSPFINGMDQTGGRIARVSDG